MGNLWRSCIFEKFPILKWKNDGSFVGLAFNDIEKKLEIDV